MFKTRLNLCKEDGLYRNPPSISGKSGSKIFIDGKEFYNFASNDYLGLSENVDLKKVLADSIIDSGSSSSSSRLVGANSSNLLNAEKKYAEYFGYENAVFFSSGFLANLALVSTISEEFDHIIYDKKIHASSIKGTHLSKSTLKGFNHSSLSHLEKRLKTCSNGLVLTEALFSMDADLLDVKGLKTLKDKYSFYSIVDEAHSFGALGDGGRGIAKDVSDISVGTLGKAFGLFGAFALVSNEVKEYLLNFATPLIYSTALPFAHSDAACKSLDLIEKMDCKRKELEDLSTYFKDELIKRGFSISGDAHIIAINIGSEEKCLNVVNELKKKSIFVLAARYPTVGLNKAIVRISLTSMHTKKEIDYFVNCLENIYEC